MSLPGHRLTGSHPPPCWRPTPPEGFVARFTRLVRDEAQELLFRELSAGRPRTPSVVSSVSPSSRSDPSSVLHLCVVPPKPPHPIHPASIPVRVNDSVLSTELGHICLASPRKSSRRVTGRHVVSTSAAHVFDFQRRAPTSRSATGLFPGRNQIFPGGPSARTVGEPASADRIAWSRASFCSTPSVFGRASDAPSPTRRSEPRWTLPSGSVEVASTTCPREGPAASLTKSAFHRQRPREAFPTFHDSRRRPSRPTPFASSPGLFPRTLD